MTDQESLRDAFGGLLDRLSARLQPVDGSAFSGVGTIHAAVILLLRPAAKATAGEADGSAEVLFIRRAQREGDPWSGHIAFPGGRPAAADPDLLAVAVRETTEEVGIDVLRGGRVLGRLPTVEPQSRRLPPVDVTPFVALAPEGVGADRNVGSHGCRHQMKKVGVEAHPQDLESQLPERHSYHRMAFRASRQRVRWALPESAGAGGTEFPYVRPERLIVSPLRT